MDEKNVPARIPEDSFFSCVFQRIFSQERGFGEVPVGQEFLYLPRNPPDLGGFRRIPVPEESCLALARD